MQINSVDIATFGAKQLKVDIGYSTFANNSVWVKGALLPTLTNNDIGFKHINVELLVKGTNKNSISLSISKILSKLIVPANLKLDGYTNNFKCTLQEHNVEKIKAKTHYKLILSFIGYEYGEEVTEAFTGGLAKELIIEGNIDTPCIVKITPLADITSLILSGFGGNTITVKNLTSGKAVTLNGEECTVYEVFSNKFNDVVLWEFPRLEYGYNEVQCSSANCNLEVTYKPRFI